VNCAQGAHRRYSETEGCIRLFNRHKHVANIAIGTSVKANATCPPKCRKSCAVMNDPSVPPSAENVMINPVIAACRSCGSALSTTELIVG
jgi:hypothetical protein